MDVQLVSPGETGSNLSSTKICNSEDKHVNNNVYGSGREEVVNTNGKEDTAKCEESMKEDVSKKSINANISSQREAVSDHSTAGDDEIDMSATSCKDAAAGDHGNNESRTCSEDVAEGHEDDESRRCPEDVCSEGHEDDENQRYTEDVDTESHKVDESQKCAEDVDIENHKDGESERNSEDVDIENHEDDETKRCSEDDAVEVHKQIDTQSLTNSSSESNTNSDRQSVEEHVDGASASNPEEPSEIGLSSEDVALEERDTECVQNDNLPVSSTNVSSESNENNIRAKTEWESAENRSPLATEAKCEKQNADSDIDKGFSVVEAERITPFDADRSDSFDDKISLFSEDEAPSKEADSREKGEAPISRAEQVAADRDRKNPAYIPRTGKFFMHDEREGEDITLEEFETCWFEKKRQEQEQLERKKGRIRYGFNGDRWGNDKFDERLQCPKTYEQIVSEYGYDIREDGQANRKKYWDGSYKYGNKEDNRQRKRRPRGGNEGGMRGRRSGGRGRSNQGPSNRSGPGYRPAANANQDCESEQRHTEDVDRVGHHCSNSDRDMRNKERLTGRDPQPTDVQFNSRGNWPQASDPKNDRRDFKAKADRPAEKDRRNRNGQEPVTVNEKTSSTTATAAATSASSQSSSSQNNTSFTSLASLTESASPKATTVLVDVATPSSVDTPDSSTKKSTVKPSDVSTDNSKAPTKPNLSVKEEPKAATSTQKVVDVSPNNNPKAPSGHGYPSNKRYSAQRRERRFDREVVPSSSRRHQQPRQQVPCNSSQASHTHQSSQMNDSHNQSKQLHHVPKIQQQRQQQQPQQQQQQRPSQLPSQSPDSRPQQQPLPMSQMPQQAPLQPDVGALPPQVNYQSMHGGLEYPAHASVIPSMPPQQELTYFGPPPAHSVHPQYLLNYFRAIPADPNLQFFAQQQVAAAAAAAALANGQFPPNGPPSAPEPAHYPAAPENTGGTVFYPPVAQQPQPQPQLTPERPRRALPIVAPSAGTES